MLIMASFTEDTECSLIGIEIPQSCRICFLAAAGKMSPWNGEKSVPLILSPNLQCTQFPRETSFPRIRSFFESRSNALPVDADSVFSLPKFERFPQHISKIFTPRITSYLPQISDRNRAIAPVEFRSPAFVVG